MPPFNPVCQVGFVFRKFIRRLASRSAEACYVPAPLLSLLIPIEARRERAYWNETGAR